jgi:hypothetical protein
METFRYGIREKHPGPATLLQVYRAFKAVVDVSFCLQIVEIDSHIACAFSGLTADSKTLIDRARVECQNHWFTYDEKMQVGYLLVTSVPLVNNLVNLLISVFRLQKPYDPCFYELQMWLNCKK